MLRHLMAKDWRYVRAGAIGSWALVVAAWAVVDLDPDLWFLTALVHALALLLPFFVFGRLLQLDPVLGDTSFWLTRPIDRTVQLASKIAVGFGAVLAPCLVLSVAPLALRGLAMTPRDYVLTLGSMVIRYMFVAWFVLIVGAVARNLAETLLAATAFALVVGGGVAIYDRYWVPADFVYEASFAVVLALLLPLQSILSIYVLYRWRRMAPAFTAFVLTGIAITAMGREWQWNLMKPLMAMAPRPAAGRRADWPIKVQVLSQHGLRREIRGAGPSLLVRIDGIPEGMSLVQTGFETRAVLWSGREAHWDYATDWKLEDELDRHWIPSAAEAALGCPRRASTVREQDVQVLKSGIDPRWMSHLDGRLRFLVVRTSVSQRAKVDGGRLRFPGGRVVGRSARLNEAVVLRLERLSLSPFPWPTRPPSPQLFDPVSGDCVSLGTPTLRGGGSFTLPIEAVESRYPDWSRRRVFSARVEGPIPESTEMAFLEREVLGTFEVPFEYVEPTRPPEAAVSPAKQRARDALWEKVAK
jgi:hypothetical protein